MLYLCLIIGALAGLILFEIEGLIPGLFMGYLIYQGEVLRKRIRTLDQEVGSLRERIHLLLQQEPAQENSSLEPQSEPAETEEPLPLTITEETIREESAVDALEAPAFQDSADNKEEPAQRHSQERQEVGRIFDTVRTFLTGGNWLLRIGVAILFIGLSFLVRLAIEYRLFPLELRLVLVGISGLSMIVIGWRLASRRPEYGLVMEGAGLAVLYLTFFASYRLYDLIPEPVALIALILITIAGVSLGLLQNAQWVAVVSMLGGFFVPVLISTDSGSHVALFSYYTILNLGILCTAWFKGWRYLNLTGFLCTFGIGTAWGGLNYSPDLLASTQPFLIAFFLIYLAISVLYGVKHRLSVKHPVDGTLVFGLPVVVFSLQASLVESIEFALAVSSLGFGVCYLGLALWLRSRSSDTHRNLIESFDGIGITLVSMVIPLSVNATWTGIGWALEGAALVWLGIQQHRLLVRAGGYVLVIASAISFIYGYTELLPDSTESHFPILNPLFMGFLTVSVAMLFVAYQVSTNRNKLFSVEFVVEYTTLIVGVIFWLAGGFTEIGDGLSSPWDTNVSIVFSGLSVYAIAFLGKRLEWIPFVKTTLFNVPTLYGLLLIGSIFRHPFEGWGILFWIVALLCSYGSLYLQEGAFTSSKHGFIHAAYVWLIALLCISGGDYLVDTVFKLVGDWQMVGSLFALNLIVAAVLASAKGDRWPFSRHRKAYLRTALMPVLGLLILVSISGSFNNAGDTAPLPYLPVLNPLDIMLLVAAALGIVWYNRLTAENLAFKSGIFRTFLFWSMVGLLFIWLNATIARTVHHWADVPYTSEIWSSSAFQSSLSICWTLLAVSTMAVAARLGKRVIWMVAACLLGVVVIKLFAVDLSSLSTVPRIISFIGVGILLLVIGYIAPAPPRIEDGMDSTIDKEPLPGIEE